MHSIVPLIVLKREPHERTMQILADNWEELQKRTMTEKNKQICYAGYSLGDVLIETFEQVSRDVEGLSVEDTLEAFVYTFKLFHKRAVLNCKDEQKKLGRWKPKDLNLEDE